MTASNIIGGFILTLIVIGYALCILLPKWKMELGSGMPVRSQRRW